MPPRKLMDEFNPSASTGDEVLQEHRNRCVMEERERAARVEFDREALRSEAKTVSARIRAWEHFHGLCLPSRAGHPIIDVIATSTGLTRAEVESEQHARTTNSRPVTARGWPLDGQ